MAIRNILKYGDPALTKVCRAVTVFDKRLWQLLDDLSETMYRAQGVGLAAPQVGILRRVVVIDAGDGLVELVNPRISSAEGEQTDLEGCLSVPGIHGNVTRPNRVTVQAFNRKGHPITLTGQGLLARAFCHEIDHLDGEIFLTKVEGELVED